MAAKKPLYELTHGGLPDKLQPDNFRKAVDEALEPLLEMAGTAWGTLPGIAHSYGRGIHISAVFADVPSYGGRRRTIRKQTFIVPGPGNLTGNKHPYAQAACLASPYYNGPWPILTGQRPEIVKPWPRGEKDLAGYVQQLTRGLDIIGLPVRAPIRVSECLQVHTVLTHPSHPGYAVKFGTNVSEDNYKSKKPHLLARDWFRCLTRMRCRDFHDGTFFVPFLSMRVRCSPHDYQLLHWQAGNVSVLSGKSYTTIKKPELAAKMLRALDMPPDPLEKLLFPKDSTRLIERLRKEKKVFAWSPDFMDQEPVVAAVAKPAAKQAGQVVVVRPAGSTRLLGRPRRDIHLD